MMFSLTGFDFTIAQIQSATTPVAIENLFFGGADIFSGSSATDIFFGFGGNDTMRGNGGNDRLTGGVGKDLLNGGAASDTFDFNRKVESTPASFDTIQAFSSPQHDHIDLSTLDATTGGANNAFLFAGAQTFAAFNATHNGGAVRAVAGVVQVDIDGNNTVDMVIKTPGATLHLADFIL
jgi:Ca2+-binding RTX toxin-like protein